MSQKEINWSNFFGNLYKTLTLDFKLECTLVASDGQIVIAQN